MNAHQCYQEEIDAQRLRADTAEAELVVMTDNFNIVVRQKMKLSKELAAAEQRIANLNIESASIVLANCMDYPWGYMPENGRALMRKHAKDIVEAALNPNHEAESHE